MSPISREFVTTVLLPWRHAQVDAGIPPICIQVKTDLTNASWLYAGQHAPVDGTNIWTNVPASQTFYRLCVTNVP